MKDAEQVASRSGATNLERLGIAVHIVNEMYGFKSSYFGGFSAQSETLTHLLNSS